MLTSSQPLSETVVATISEGVEEEATLRGLSTLVTDTHDEAGRRTRLPAQPARHQPAHPAQQLGRGPLPFWTARPSRSSTAAPTSATRRSTCDDHLGGRLVAEHSLALGHHRVAVIAGEPCASGGTDRYREAGLPLSAHGVRHCHFDTTGGHRATVELLNGPDRPTAIFTVNDLAAIGTIGAARDLSPRLSEDLALADFNDTLLAAELPVPLTSVHSPMAGQKKPTRRMSAPAPYRGRDRRLGDAQADLVQASTGTAQADPGISGKA
ncbi:substrate-binding domain-containing protein [Streptomyces sp. NPDC001020]